MLPSRSGNLSRENILMSTGDVITVNFKITNLFNNRIMIFHIPKRFVQTKVNIFTSSACLNFTFQMRKHDIQVTA